MISDKFWLLAALIIFVNVIVISSARLPDPPVFSAVQHYISICYLPPDSGLCHGDQPTDNNTNKVSSNNGNSVELLGELQTHYYFDIVTEQCYPFGTQNCGGNENRFQTLSDCQSRCRINNSLSKN